MAKFLDDGRLISAFANFIDELRDSKSGNEGLLRIGTGRTRGDRALVWDPPLAPGDVLGTVVWVEGKGRPRSFAAGCRSLASGLLARAQMAFHPAART